MTVILQSASGRVLSVFVDATSENRATGSAMRQANKEHGRQGWLPIRCEHGRKVIR